MTKTRLLQASEQVERLDKTTQEIISTIESKDRRFRFWGYLSLTLLLIVGVVGIYKQNEIATKNQQHIDCIVKLFTTPLPANERSRTIQNPSSTCDIKFTQ